MIQRIKFFTLGSRVPSFHSTTLLYRMYYCIYLHVYLQYAGPDLDTETTTLQTRTTRRKAFSQTLKVIYFNLSFLFLALAF